MSTDSADPLLEVRDLKKYFPVESGAFSRLFGGEQRYVKAVDGVSFSIDRGETLGLVGESGCGKSTLGETIAQLQTATAGEIRYDGRRIDDLEGKELRALRKDVQFVFQDPAASLNPRRRVRDIIRRPMDVHNIGDSKRERNDRVAELAERVGLSRNQLDRYPHEFSGGQQQRIAIARALAVDPEFIVCDEPTSALDVSVQANILNLLNELQEEFGLTYLFITHDLSVVQHISDHVAVMYLGEIMELGSVEDVFDAHQHPYTDALFQAIPDADGDGRQFVLRGEIPSPIDPPSGCPFRTRCPLASEECASEFDAREFSATHTVNCVKRDPATDGDEPIHIDGYSD